MFIRGRTSNWEEWEGDGDEMCDGDTGKFQNSGIVKCNGAVSDNQNLDRYN